MYNRSARTRFGIQSSMASQSIIEILEDLIIVRQILCLYYKDGSLIQKVLFEEFFILCPEEAWHGEVVK